MLVYVGRIARGQQNCIRQQEKELEVGEQMFSLWKIVSVHMMLHIHILYDFTTTVLLFYCLCGNVRLGGTGLNRGSTFRAMKMTQAP